MDAISLLSADEEGEEEEEEEKGSFDKTIMPEVIILLEASDSFLRNRIMNLSEMLVSSNLSLHITVLYIPYSTATALQYILMCYIIPFHLQ